MPFGFLPSIILLLLTVVSFSAAPPANTIPIIGLKPSYEDIDTNFFCFLSWNNFDGLSRQFFDEDSILNNVVLPADTTGMITVINPWNLSGITNVFSHMFPMYSDSAFARPVWNGLTIDGITYTKDSLTTTRTASEMIAEMENVADNLETLFNQESHSVWFYYGYDEAPAKQWNRMITDSIDHVYSGYDNYMPSMFTQEMDSVLRLDLDSTFKWQPTLEEVDTRGVISWMNHYIKQADSSREFCYVISTMHTINDKWADYDNVNSDNNETPPNFSNQAQAVRSLFDMEYQGYIPDSIQPAKEPNYPSSIALDAYPFRLVGTLYQDTASYIPELGDSLDNWMLDHYEIGMDSTFITAWNIRNSSTPEKDISVFFVPQAFGRAGGPGMWTNPAPPDLPVLSFHSYNYRIPTPQEFRMTCNSSLIRGAKALLPYCLTSYIGGGGDKTNAGFLDQNHIPFNAPYEDWVYRDRPADSISFINPDLIPPFMNGFDPLYTLPDRPYPQGQKATEILLKWKFAAYGRLWDSAKKTFGDIARVAPELALLNWWEDHEDCASISYNGTEPSMFRTPQVKVFTDSTESTCYLFYLNRFCRANDNPFSITVSPTVFPAATEFSTYALDHNRRCLVEGTQSMGIITFYDTLNAGEARLLQMYNSDSGLIPDVRITDPDLNVILPTRGDTLLDYQSTPGTPIDIIAQFYNMGTDSIPKLWVFLYDETNSVKLDSTRIRFDGLSTSSCYTVDMERATFHWTPNSNDVGVHILKVYTEEVAGEADTTDNSATLVYVVNPGDYATEVLDNPWNMTEATGFPKPVWITNDISNMTGCWDLTAYTDSITGMFEGELTNPTLTNALYLNTGSGSSDYIDADIYHNLSLAGRSRTKTLITVHWLDSNNHTDYVTLNNAPDTLRAIASDLGPWDLSSLSANWTGDIKKLWLEFNGTGMLPVSVRLGWVKLTE